MGLGRRIGRRKFLYSVLGSTLAPACFSALAQPRAKTWHIGFLGDGTPTSRAAEFREFRAGMAELGYREGRNLVIEARWTDGIGARRSALAQELVRMNVDVMVTHGEQAALAAKAATTTIPIVVAVSADFLVNGLVKSLSHPGGNLTGRTDQVRALAAKEVQLLKEVLPNAQLAGVLWESDNINASKAVEDMQAAARDLHLRLLAEPVRTPEEIASAFDRMASGGVTAALVLHTPLTMNHRGDIARIAVQKRIALVGAPVQFAEAGALFSYGPDLPQYFRQAATLVDKILKGAKPQDMPIEQATKFEFVINMRTARALGVSIPPSIFVRADRVID